MNFEIKLVQKPVIKHALLEVGKSVTSRLEELNIEKLVATDETIQSLKKLRTDLNGELKEYEDQRKTVKSAIANPYSKFETEYKKQVAEKYKKAISTLKDKIGEFENKVKAEKKANIELYFNELCQANNIDFLKFKDTGIEINLSTSKKQYQKKCDDFVGRIADDILLIDSLEFPAEIMAEYKSNGLNASAAIKTIKDRKDAEKLEADRLKQDETNRRTKLLGDLTMIYHGLTHTYNWVQDESIYIEQKDIENLSKDEFQKRFVEIESTIKTKQKELRTKATSSNARTAGTPSIGKTETPTPSAPAQPLKAPVQEVKTKQEKIFTASFECKGTMAELKALGQYMKEHHITYKNI